MTCTDSTHGRSRIPENVFRKRIVGLLPNVR
jgi:hypothetical protein